MARAWVGGEHTEKSCLLHASFLEAVCNSGTHSENEVQKCLCRIHYRICQMESLKRTFLNFYFPLDNEAVWWILFVFTVFKEMIWHCIHTWLCNLILINKKSSYSNCCVQLSSMYWTEMGTGKECLTHSMCEIAALLIYEFQCPGGCWGVISAVKKGTNTSLVFILQKRWKMNG